MSTKAQCRCDHKAKAAVSSATSHSCGKQRIKVWLDQFVDQRHDECHQDHRGKDPAEEPGLRFGLPASNPDQPGEHEGRTPRAPPSATGRTLPTSDHKSLVCWSMCGERVRDTPFAAPRSCRSPDR